LSLTFAAQGFDAAQSGEFRRRLSPDEITFQGWNPDNPHWLSCQLEASSRHRARRMSSRFDLFASIVIEFFEISSRPKSKDAISMQNH